MKPESVILAEILLAWGSHPRVRLFRVNAGLFIAPHAPRAHRVRSAPTGTSDVLGILAPAGRWVAIEVKSASGRLRPEQLAFLNTIRAFGGLGIEARSVEDVDALLVPIVGSRITATATPVSESRRAIA